MFSQNIKTISQLIFYQKKNTLSSIIKAKSTKIQNQIFSDNKFSIKSPFILKYKFSAVSFKDIKSMQDPTKKTSIISLNQQQLEQLSTITNYMVSINHLQKNNLQQSLQFLDYSITEAKNNFSESINLHMCLLNRKSILLKLLNKDEQFVTTLQQIFFMCQSLKGLRNLDTQKHLRNYLLAMVFNNKEKMAMVLEFVINMEEMVRMPKLKQKIKDFVFYDGIVDVFVRNEAQQGFAKLQSLPEQTFHQKYFKTNNLAWMQYINLKNITKSQSALTKKLKDQGQPILKSFLRALFDMQYCVPQNIKKTSQQQQPPKNTLLIQLIKGYLVGNINQLQFIPDHVKLSHPQSHIITMNIANLLFQSQRYEQCVYFMKLSLSSALDMKEVERVGLCLLLLIKIDFKSGQNWEKIVLNMLEHNQTYPQHIIKECLSLYSLFLFKQARYAEAENYANQMQKLKGNLDLEGLLLPEYDFSF